ncbi:hypothetical protein B0A48_11348 [Cryoendolithus antarcticus]|uniref:Uncharacterized protein n=1 Tax=Cryoendolithus antarcticus TaxID=1507870 RepID=A0A1V8SVB0_9PEZI|nr:hypothetical protein B0A48_11348 [Cryoendolithus antarcticus]
MEAAVRWSGHSNEEKSRFLLVDFADSSLFLHEVDGIKDRNVTHHRVAHLSKLPSFNAFDWSRTTPSIAALGLTTGYASIVQLSEDAPPEILTTYRVKQQRKCTSIALSRESWLAVALDKARSDVCLNVYDAGAQYGAGNARTTTSPSLHALTKNINTIAIDPCDENYFASVGSVEGPFMSLWDRRRMSNGTDASNTGAVLEFTSVVDNRLKATVSSLSFAGLQRGRLAISSSLGELKVIDMILSNETFVQQSQYAPTNPYGGIAWTSNDCVSETRVIQSPNQDIGSGKHNVKQAIAFDWMASDAHVVDQGILVLRADRSLDVVRARHTKPIACVTARQELSVAEHDMQYLKSVTASQGDARDPSPTYVSAPAETEVTRMLAPSTMQRDRCRRGYLFDSRKNAEIVRGDWQLQRLWEIVERFHSQASNSGMVYNNVDLSYIGVAGIWSENLGNIFRRTYAPHDLSFEDMVVGLNEALSIPQFDGERTDFPEHRQLCLAICGWKFTSEALETECQELIERGLYYQAIVQAVLHGEKHMALNLFRSLTRSKFIQQNGIGALLASDNLNEAQREMCLWMSADTDDLALKALLTFLEKGDWRDVMKTNYLHLGYRVALGCKYLNDTELSGFLQTETARAIRNGDLEGILLTGLGEQAMHLMQTYLTRTNDLQTAVLATAFTNPRCVDDVRWEMWKEVYFQQLQSWRCFGERARFTVQYNRMSVSREGKSMIQSPKGQITLRCVGCQGSLARTDSRYVLGKASDSSIVAAETPNAKGPAAQTGTVCLKCGRHLPRCAVCMMWLGTPENARTRTPGTTGAAAAMKGFLSFCLACGHAYHADHAMEWFGKHRECAVPGCKCACGVKSGYTVNGA